MKESFIRVENGEVYIYGMHISPYEKGNIFNKDPMRVRKLLLHRYEINKIEGSLQEKGLTLVPLKVYFKDSLVKLEIGVARGKKLYDKRQDIAKDISEGLARVACVAELDGEVVDLRTIVDGEHKLNILTFDSDEGKAAFRHTASHVLAQAIKRLYPDAKCAIGPSIEEGFYYDFDIAPLDREALDKIEKEMKKEQEKHD